MHKKTDLKNSFFNYSFVSYKFKKTVALGNITTVSTIVIYYYLLTLSYLIIGVPQRKTTKPLLITMNDLTIAPPPRKTTKHQLIKGEFDNFANKRNGDNSKNLDTDEHFWNESNRVIHEMAALFNEKKQITFKNICEPLLTKLEKKLNTENKKTDKKKLIVNSSWFSSELRHIKHENQFSTNILKILRLMLCLERAILAFDTNDEYAHKYCIKSNSTYVIISTPITEKEYGKKYNHRMKDLAKSDYYKLNYSSLVSRPYEIKISNENPILVVIPTFFITLEQEFLEVVKELKNSSLSEKDKLSKIAEIYIKFYFTHHYIRGAAHNSLIFMMALYNFAFSDKPLPKFKYGIMPDLELFQSNDYNESKKIFIEKFSNKEFFE